MYLYHFTIFLLIFFSHFGPAFLLQEKKNLEVKKCRNSKRKGIDDSTENPNGEKAQKYSQFERKLMQIHPLSYDFYARLYRLRRLSIYK